MFGTNEIVGKKFFRDAPVDSLFVTSMFFTLQGEGPFAGQPALFIRLTKCNLTCNFCFPSNLRLTVKGKGSLRLDEVKKGDQIITLDDSLHPTFTTVKETNSRWVDSDQMVNIKYREGKVVRQIMATKEHPFNVKGKGFVDAGDLKEGMVIHHLEGSERLSFQMAENNPMWDKKIAKQAGETTRDRYASGELKAYERSNSWRRNQSARMAKKNPMHDHNTVKKVTESKVYEKSALEKKVHKILRGAGFYVKYTGNRKGWMIGNSTFGYKRPDFVFEGTKKILEVYDRSYPFYTDHKHTKRGERDYKETRRAHYKRFGYQVGFLTAQDLGLSGFYKTMSTPVEVIREKVNTFLTNGVTVISVDVIRDKRAFSTMARAETYKAGKVKVTNFTCDGNNTFCMKGLHTHNCDTFFDQGDWMTFEQIERMAYTTICNYWNLRRESVPLWALNQWPAETVENNAINGVKLGPYPGIVLVITGGEPLLQNNLTAFLQRQAGKFKEVQIESNGLLDTYIPDFVTLVCSPKCSEKSGKAIKYLEPSSTILNRADCLKFVMCADPTSPYSEVPKWAHNWRTTTGKDIYVSPMNIYNDIPRNSKVIRLTNPGRKIEMDVRSTTDEVISFWTPGLLNQQANQVNHEYTAKYALSNGFKLNLQLHLYASMA